MQIVCLTGWQQQKDALANIAPDAQHFDYAAYDNVADVFAALPKTMDIAIGWSLGGQLLARAVSGRYIRPKKLVLIAAAFQFVADDGFAGGVPKAAFEKIRDNYMRNPQEAVAGLQSLISVGDKQAISIARTLSATKEIWGNGLFWLDELAKTRCYDLHFRLFPETVIVHGENDKVTGLDNAREFADALPGGAFFTLPDCGHAPHLHDPEGLKRIIGDCV